MPETEPNDPKKLDYASPADVDPEDKGVRRYYREPPDVDRFIVAFVAIGVVVLLFLAYLVWKALS